MARARTYLLTATLEPTVDWVLWLDGDIGEFSPTLFRDLLLYGNAGVVDSRQQQLYDFQPCNEAENQPWNDVIVPNALKRMPDGALQGFDLNNWAETPESLKLKAGLADDELLIEGNIWQHMQRRHLADYYTPYTPLPTFAPHLHPRALPQIFSSADTLNHGDQRMNQTSPAYIGRTMELDGIGGVAALVRAEVHRMGATFPAWVFDHQLETEAFGVLAKKLGARVVGLPNLFVLHCEFTCIFCHRKLANLIADLYTSAT